MKPRNKLKHVHWFQVYGLGVVWSSHWESTDDFKEDVNVMSVKIVLFVVMFVFDVELERVRGDREGNAL